MGIKKESKPLPHVDVGEIELGKKELTEEEKNEILHKAALAAAKPVKEEPSKEEIEAKNHKALLQQADELAEQAQDIEQIKFTAKDLSNFSAMTDQNANKTFDSKMPPKPKEKVAVQLPSGPKTFFEELLDKQKA